MRVNYCWDSRHVLPEPLQARAVAMALDVCDEHPACESLKNSSQEDEGDVDASMLVSRRLQKGELLWFMS